LHTAMNLCLPLSLLLKCLWKTTNQYKCQIFKQTNLSSTRCIVRHHLLVILNHTLQNYPDQNCHTPTVNVKQFSHALWTCWHMVA
jgi:hypothetical protein